VQFWGLSGPLKSIANLCCNVWNKRETIQSSIQLQCCRPVGVTLHCPLMKICPTAMWLFIKILWPLVIRPYHTQRCGPIATDGVARSVCLSVCWLVCEPAKTAEPIEMPTYKGIKNHVLEGVNVRQIHSWHWWQVGNEAFCQITLNSCYYCYNFYIVNVSHSCSFRD